MLVCKYKFDSSIYADLIPVFNDGYGGYAIEDVVEGNIITRTIEADELPSLMRFGSNLSPYVEGSELALLEILDMNTSELTNMNQMFRYCQSLTSIICNWDTSKVTNMNYMFADCINLIQLDVSNWNTSKVTNMSYIFYHCSNLTQLDVSNWNTSQVINMSHMFDGCYELISIGDTSNWNTSEVTDAGYMFQHCYKLKSLNVSKWNTSKITTLVNTFNYCQSLTLLDLSNWDTSKVTNLIITFRNCTSLTSLDLSNFNTDKVSDINNIFQNCISLTDIGMLYCSSSTINTLCSYITSPTTVWVDGDMIDELTPYNNVTYEAYYYEKELLLNSPLLEGDKIVKMNGKTYHYHKMGKVVLDGSEDWILNTNNNNNYFYAFNILPYDGTDISSKGFSDKLSYIPINSGSNDIGVFAGYSEKTVGIRVLQNDTVEDVKQWLSENPTTVVYELKNPYYELISEEDLSIPLTSENVTISNNSLIPTNMNVKNNGMSTVGMATSTKYTVAFDKDTDDSITIDLCGSTIDTTDNVVEITTPSELTNDEITFIGDCEVSNVRILEGSVSGDAIPRESFEGIKSSFEDGKIENGIDTSLLPFTITGVSDASKRIIYFDDTFHFKPMTTYIIRIKLSLIGEDNLNTHIRLSTSRGKGDGVSVTFDESQIMSNENYIKCIIKTDNTVSTLAIYHVNSAIDVGTSYGSVSIDDLIIVEEGTHLTEEDFNHLGKYKVEYNVVGKNKFDLYKPFTLNYGSANVGGNVTIVDNGINPGGVVGNYSSKSQDYTNILKSNTNYTLSAMSKGCGGYIRIWDNIKHEVLDTLDMEAVDTRYSITFNIGDLNPSDVRITSHMYIDDGGTIQNIQLEEGTVATEYEPYKSYTKTFYLNSPLLEGDTIEDINGKATHVHRYGKVILDGSEDEGWSNSSYLSDNVIRFYTTIRRNISRKNSIVYCDRFKYDSSYGNYKTGESELIHHDQDFNFVIYKSCLSTPNLEGFKQWLQENPTTVVYELASPTYETISEESILSDSYANGHLDVNTNVPISKVAFKEPSVELKYLHPNTSYTIQLDSDNIGKMDTYFYFGSRYSNINIIKGANKFYMTTPSEISQAILYFNGIGFNASNIQVVATDRDNIGYFKGIQSSFEDCIIEDEADENNGRYAVEVSMIGKNKWKYGDILNKDVYRVYLDEPLKKGNYVISSTCGRKYESNPYITFLTDEETITGVSLIKDGRLISISKDVNSIVIYSNGYDYVASSGKLMDFTDIQLEEGTTKTEYEPYKETRKTIYLNSPLLKGDRIEMYNGKLCHYHKMGMVVLDGSEDENWGMNYGGLTLETRPNTRHFYSSILDGKTTSEGEVSDKFKVDSIFDYDIVGFCIYGTSLNDIRISHTSKSVEEFKQWLQNNPTTVVYTSAQPYYEDITPIQNEFTIISIGESSFTIDSGAIPTNGEITYSVNVKLLNDLEESINNSSSTNISLSNLLDDIINE